MYLLQYSRINGNWKIKISWWLIGAIALVIWLVL